jgi:hypothetical protein
VSTKGALRIAQFGRRNLFFHGMIHPPSRSPVGCVVRELTSVGAKTSSLLCPGCRNAFAWSWRPRGLMPTAM